MPALPLLFPVALFLVGAPDIENRLHDQLTTQGISTGADETVFKLPAPSMPDGLEAAAQHELIKKIAGRRRPLEQMMRDSIVAPFVLKISQASDDRKDVRHVDIWYVARGRLDQFTDRDFFGSMVDFGASQDSNMSAKLLSDKQLAQRGVTQPSDASSKEYFLFHTIELFDRVSLSTTRRVVVSGSEESVIVAAVVDPRFSGDVEYPNQWRSITLSAGNRRELGAVHPYLLSGSYTKVTQLKEPKGSLFIEHHHLFAEPEGWFGGRNLLRSKLPLVVQRGVRQLRQRLKAENP